MSKSRKSQLRRGLFSEAKQFIDIHALFPKSKNVGRAPLTDYQARKIRKELGAFYAHAGGIDHAKRDAVTIKRTAAAKQYLKDAGYPASAKAVFLPGGEKSNGNISFKGGMLRFTRGEIKISQYPIDAITEHAMLKSIRSHATDINQENSFTYIATSGGKITITGTSKKLEKNITLDEVERKAKELYSRYASLADAGLNRPERIGKGARRAAHPSKWGMTLWIEKEYSTGA